MQHICCQHPAPLAGYPLRNYTPHNMSICQIQIAKLTPRSCRTPFARRLTSTSGPWGVADLEVVFAPSLEIFGHHLHRPSMPRSLLRCAPPWWNLRSLSRSPRCLSPHRRPSATDSRASRARAERNARRPRVQGSCRVRVDGHRRASGCPPARRGACAATQSHSPRAHPQPTATGCAWRIGYLRCPASTLATGQVVARRRRTRRMRRAAPRATSSSASASAAASNAARGDAACGGVVPRGREHAPRECQCARARVRRPLGARPRLEGGGRRAAPPRSGQR